MGYPRPKEEVSSWSCSELGTTVVGTHSYGGALLSVGTASGPMILEVLRFWPGHSPSTRDVMGNVTGNAPSLPSTAVPSLACASGLTWPRMGLECGASVPWGGESWDCGLGPEFYNYSVQLCELI